MRRRIFVLGVAAMATGMSDPAQGNQATAQDGQSPFTLTLTPEQRKRLADSIAAQGRSFDPAAKLLSAKIGGDYNYNTHLRNTTAHPTRESLAYAVNLLDTGIPADAERAFAILHRILEIQDNDPKSNSFGVWPHYAEEPSSRAPYVDRNWADFLGVLLLQVVLYHRHRLPEDLRTGIEMAIRNAATAIQKRNVGPGYTNIAVMGTYVTLVAGETFGDAALKDYGMERLRLFHAHSRRADGFTEYNSPTYTIVSLREIARLRQHTRTPEAKPLIEEVYRMAWAEIANHFHPPTRQWAGPHSRAYSTLLRPSDLAFIEAGTGGKASFGLPESARAGEEHRVSCPCPPDLIPLFIEMKQPRRVVTTFIPDTKTPTIGTTFLEPRYALGTINRGTFWNQARPLILYFGTIKEPSYFRVRLLHDGYDLAAGRIFCRQQEGNVLAAVVFATDGGDKHPSLDKIKDATLTASDLRLRFEVGGAAARFSLPNVQPDATQTLLDLGGLPVRLVIGPARFGDTPVVRETGKDANTAYLDLVLYSGAAHPINLAAINAAAVGFGIQVGSADDSPLKTVEQEETLKITFHDMSLSFPIKPLPSAEVNRLVL